MAPLLPVTPDRLRRTLGVPPLHALAPTAEEHAWWRRARLRPLLLVAVPTQLLLLTSSLVARAMDHGAASLLTPGGLRLAAAWAVVGAVAGVGQSWLMNRTLFAQRLAGRRLRQALAAELAAGDVPSSDAASASRDAAQRA